MTEPGLTEGWLLGGTVAYAQPAGGHRSGIEPVLMAAAVPARPGQRVLEGGTGAGAGLLCLARRVGAIGGLGVEIEPALAAVAARNFAADRGSHLQILLADIRALPVAAGSLDHAFANPPWHDAAGSASPDALKRRAKVAPSGLVGAWVAALATALRDGGTLTLALATAAAPEALEALRTCGCGSARLCPLWPRPGRAPRIVLLQAVKGGRSPFRLLPGLVLHGEGGYTAAAEDILRRGEPLRLG